MAKIQDMTGITLVTRKDGSQAWEIRLSTRENGKQKAYCATVDTSEGAARKKRDELRVQIALNQKNRKKNGANVSVGDIPFAVAFDRFIAEKTLVYDQKKTAQGYTELGVRLKKAFGPVPFGKLDRAMVRKQIKVWKKSGKLKPIRGQAAIDLKEGLSDYHINKHLSLLGTVYNYFIEEVEAGDIMSPVSKNMMFKIPKPKQDETTTYSWAQVNQLFAAADAYPARSSFNKLRLKAVTHLMIFLGLRRGEVFGLSFDSIDFEKKKLHIWQVVEIDASEKRTPVLKPCPKTEDSDRWLAIDDYTLAILKALRSEYNKLKLASKGLFDANNHRLVFGDVKGNPYSGSNFNCVYTRLVKRAKLPYVSPHQLRHTFGTLQRAAGIDMETIAKRMGHKSRMVTDIYAEWNVEMDRRCQNILIAAYEGSLKVAS